MLCVYVTFYDNNKKNHVDGKGILNSVIYSKTINKILKIKNNSLKINCTK